MREEDKVTYDEGWEVSLHFAEVGEYKMWELQKYADTLIAGTNSVGKPAKYLQGRLDCYKHLLTVKLLKGEIE